MQEYPIENTLNPLIGLGHGPEVFSDEDKVVHIWMNKFDLRVCFNLWIDFKIMNYLFEFIVNLFQDTLSTCH